MKNRKNMLIIPAAFTTAAIIIPISNIHAAGFYLSAPESVNENSPFSVTVGGDVVGRFDVSVTNGSSNTPNLFIESIGNIGSFTITPNGEGPVYVKVVATDVTDSKYNTVSGAQGVTVNIKKKAPVTPPSSNQSNNKHNDVKQEDTKISEKTPLKEDVHTPKDKKKETTFIEASLKKDTIFEISSSLDSADLIKGFEKKKIELIDINGKKKKVEAYEHMESKIHVIYARIKGEKNYQFYLLDKDNKSIISTFKQVAIAGREYGIVDDLNTFEYCKNILNDTSFFEETTINIDSASYRGFNYKDTNYKNYHLIYLMNEKGELMMYQYETTSKTLQPFKLFIKTEMKDIKPIDEPVINDTLTGELTLREKFIIAVSSILVIFICISTLIRQKRINKKFKMQIEKIKESMITTNENPRCQEIEATRILPTLRPQDSELSEEIVEDDEIAKNKDEEDIKEIPDFKRKK